VTDDRYQRYLSEFGERLTEAAHAQSRGPHRIWPIAGGVALALALAAIVLLGGPSGNDKINVVAEARAALPQSGELVHIQTVTTTSLIGADDAAQERFDEFAHRHWDEYAPRSFEQWSTEGRWRVAEAEGKVFPKMFAGEPYYPGFYISDQELRRIGLAEEVVGPTQEAYADGIDSLYVENPGVLIHSDLGDGAGVGDLGSFPGGIYSGAPTLLGSDPIDALREALNRGNLRDEGTGEVNGQTVRRLVSEEGVNFEYDVDAETFEPVRVRSFGHWVGEVDSPYPPERMVEDVNFEEFEALPLDSNTEGLLEINPPAGTTVVEARGPDDQPPRKQR
jgi:hypothetical protein